VATATVAPRTFEQSTRGPDNRLPLRDSVRVVAAGQLGRVLGIVTALALRWMLEPALLGVYSGLRVFLDQTNRTSLGIGLGAAQEVPSLRARGRYAEARDLTDVAYTTTTITCVIYAVVLMVGAVVWWSSRAGRPFGAEWAAGLAIVAGLTVLQRRMSFHVAMLRARGQFGVTAELDALEAVLGAVITLLGVWLAGFWGLLAAVGLILALKSAWLSWRRPLRFRHRFDLASTIRLARVGLPIFANTALFGAVMSLDRVLILTRLPDGARAAGLYSAALLATGWSLDIAGRIATVLDPHFRVTLGRGGSVSNVIDAANRASRAQAPALFLLSLVVFAVGPIGLGLVLPKYEEGLTALRPLVPGTLALAMSWPSRQALIALERPWRLGLATAIGLIVGLVAGTIAADRAGIEGVAAVMSLSYALMYLGTNLALIVPERGVRSWLRHEAAMIGAMLGRDVVRSFLAGGRRR
jgi:O-antigen/teichoic acid export membrane protein